MGLEILEKELKELGFESSRLNNMVVFDYTIPVGRFRDKKIKIALEAPSFPTIPPAGIYITPHLLPINTKDKTLPLGGIHDRKNPSSEWQYWSRRFNDWNKTAKNMKTYLKFINTIFDFK